MTATLNASAGGVVLTSDTSGNLALQSGGVTKMTIGSGGVTDIAATQAEQETGTSVVKYVTSGRQQYHASAAKFWARYSSVTGTPTIAGSYNVASLTDNGTGSITVNFTTSFSSANYSAVASAGTQDVSVAFARVQTYATGSVRVMTTDTSSTLTDFGEIQVAGYGDQ